MARCILTGYMHGTHYYTYFFHHKRISDTILLSMCPINEIIPNILGFLVGTISCMNCFQEAFELLNLIC